MGGAYGVRPSSLLGLDPTDWTAWQFDATVLMFGRWVEAKLNERDKQGKPVNRMETLLLPYGEANQKDNSWLRGAVTRKVKVRPDGTWE
jgi:hypothetical protein